MKKCRLSIFMGLYISIIGILSSLHAQNLPSFLFPNQGVYDIEQLLQQGTKNNPYILEEASITNQLTLRQAVDLAIQNNLELAQTKKELDSAEALYGGSIQDFYVPNLSVGISSTLSSGFSSDPAAFSPLNDGIFAMNLALPSVVLSKTIFNGLANLYSYRIAKQNFLNAQNTYTNQIRDIVYQTSVQYYDQFLKQDEVLLSLDRLKQLQEQLTQAEINFANGRVSDFDVSLTRSQYHAAQPVYFTAEKNRLVSRENFYRYIGYTMTNDSIVELQGDLMQVTNVVFSEFDDQTSIDYILSNDSMLASLRSAYNNAKSQKGLQNSVRLPKLDLRVNYTPSWGSDVAVQNFSQSYYSGQIGVSASLQIPILEWIPGTGAASQVKSAEANIVRSQFALLDAEEQKIIEIKNNLLTIKEFSQSVDAFRIAEIQARRAAEIAQERYRFGRISLIELNQAQVDYADARRNLLTSVYNELLSKLTLQRSIHSLPSFIQEIEKIQNQNNIVE